MKNLERKVQLQIEALDERIAPSCLLVTTAGGISPGQPVLPEGGEVAILEAAKVASDGVVSTTGC